MTDQRPKEPSIGADESSGAVSAGGPPLSEELFYLTLAGLFTLPLLANPVADAFGWHIFFLKDPYIQMVWATLVLVLGGGRFYRAAFRDLLRLVPSADLFLALLITTMYGYSLYQTLSLARPGLLARSLGVGNGDFLLPAATVTMIALVRLLRAARGKRRLG